MEKPADKKVEKAQNKDLEKAKLKVEKMRKHNNSCLIIWDRYIHLIQKKLEAKRVSCTMEEIRQAVLEDIGGRLDPNSKLGKPINLIFEENKVSAS